MNGSCCECMGIIWPMEAIAIRKVRADMMQVIGTLDAEYVVVCCCFIYVIGY